MLQRGGDERKEPWTLAEGVRDALRVLAWRAPLAIAAWALLLFGVRGYLGLLLDIGGDGAAAARQVTGWAGRRGSLGIGGAFVMGAGIGWLLARDLVDRVRFTGWVLRGLAVGTAAIAILGTTVVFASAMPAALSVYLAVLGALGVGAAATTIFVGTWGE